MYVRVIHLNAFLCSELQNDFFATFLGRIRIFWKMMFGKMQIIFYFEHSNACQKCRKVLEFTKKAPLPLS